MTTTPPTTPEDLEQPPLSAEQLPQVDIGQFETVKVKRIVKQVNGEQVGQVLLTEEQVNFFINFVDYSFSNNIIIF